MNPRKVLTAAADRPAEAETERRQHLRERAAVGPEHHTGAERRDADARRLGRARRLLPAPAEAREKVVARRRGFGEPLVAAIAVPADGAAGDEHARPRGRRSDGADEIPRDADAARLEHTPPLGGPPSADDRLAREVHDRLGAHDRGGKRLRPCCAHELDIAAEHLARARLGAHPRDDRVAIEAQPRNQRAADEAGAARDENTHGVPSLENSDAARCRFGARARWNHPPQSAPAATFFVAPHTIVRGATLVVSNSSIFFRRPGSAAAVWHR